MKISNQRRKHGIRLRPVMVTVQVDSLVRGYLCVILNYYKFFRVADMVVRVAGKTPSEFVIERRLYFPIVKLAKKDAKGTAHNR